MLKVGSKFYTFDELSRRLEEFQQFEQVQLWVRDSRTVVAAAKRARRKSLNPALKYAELTYSCVFGGRRPSDQTKTHNQTSAGGCPFKVRLSTSNDGQALVVKEICHDHNHEPGKKLHEEPRRLYRNKANSRTSVRKQVRCIVNKQRSDCVTPSCLPPRAHLTQPDSGAAIRLAQSPFHHLQLHNQQQQLQIKLQLEQHLQQQRIRQQQLEEVIQLDSPDHIDTPDHLGSPDLSCSFETLGNLISSAEQYSYLPPSPISPSSSSVSSCGQAGYTSEEEGVIEPIVDLDVALEEALGDLDSVSSMDLEDKFSFVPLGSKRIMQSTDVEPSLTALPISASPSISSTLASHHDDDPCAPPPTKRFKGRSRKQSFTGNQAEKEAEEETDFIGFSPVKSREVSPSMGNTSVDLISEQDISHANTMARQLHVFKPGIDFVSGAKLEVLDARDNKWYHSKIVEVDWGELDILVHYDRWSVRFDEWLKMDSTRIRPLSISKKDKSKQFKVGEKVLGFWAPDSNYYLGEITRISSEDYYEILFYDGYTKSLRSSQIKKLLGKDIKSYMSKEGTILEMPTLKTVSGTTPARLENRRRSVVPSITPVETPPLTPILTEKGLVKGWTYETEKSTSKTNIFDVEILEAKRKTKRKPDVEELFKSLKKKRKLEEMLEDDFKHNIEQSPSKLEESKKPLNDQKTKRELELQINQAEEVCMPSKAITIEEAKLNQVSDNNYFEIELGYNWKKIARKRQMKNLSRVRSHWDVFYVSPTGMLINNRQLLTKMVAEYRCSIEAKNADFSYKTARLEYEAKYGGVLIKQEPGTPSIHSEASFSEIYEPAAEPFGGKKIKIDPTVLVESDIEAESSSYASSSGTDDGNDASDNGDEDKKFFDVTNKSIHQEDKVMNSSNSYMDDLSSSDSEVGYGNKNVSSVKLSEFLPEEKNKMLNVEESCTNIDAALTNTEESLADSDSESVSKSSTVPNNVTSAPISSPPLPTHQSNVVSSYSSSMPSISSPPLSKSRRKSISSLQMNKGTKQSSSKISDEIDRSPVIEKSYQCPKKSCEKSFRKENLLQMHLKNYHPELLKEGLSHASKLTNLAYSRSIGEYVESASPSSPNAKLHSEILTRKSSRMINMGDDSKIPLNAAKEIVGMNSRIKDLSGSLSNLEDKTELKDEIKTSSTKSVLDSTAKTRTNVEILTSRSKAKERNVENKQVYPNHGETYLLRTRKPDSVSENAETEDEPTDGVGDTQADGYEEAIINCGCKSTEEDGLMLQCDVCLCWQHGGCYNIEREDQVPDSYICSLCENPRGQRSSMRFRHNQDWLKEGKLPRFSFSTGKPSTKLQSFVKRGHELSANVLQLTQLIHSLRLKLSISKAADHPKFVMWHKKWDSSKEEFGLESISDISSQLSPGSGIVTPTSSILNSIQNSQRGVQTSMVDAANVSIKKSSNPEIPNSYLQNLPVASQINRAPLDTNVGTNDQISLNIIDTQLTGLSDFASSNSAADEVTDALAHGTKEFDNTCFIPQNKESNSHLEIETRNMTENDLTFNNSPIQSSKENSNENEDNALAPRLTKNTENNVFSPNIVINPLLDIKCEPKPHASSNLLNKIEQCRENVDENVELASSNEASTLMDFQTSIDQVPIGVPDLLPNANRVELGVSKNIENVKMCNLTDSDLEKSDNPHDNHEQNIIQGLRCDMNENASSVCTSNNVSEGKLEETNVTYQANNMVVTEDQVHIMESVTTNQSIKKDIHTDPICDSKHIPITKEENQVSSSSNSAVESTLIEEDRSHQSSSTQIMFASPEEKENSASSVEDSDKVVDIKIRREDAETDPAVSLDADDFDIELGGLGTTGDTGINDGAVLAELLSNSSLERFVDQASKELVTLNHPPIIPQAERIEPTNCKLNLLQHVETVQNQVFRRFDLIEKELNSLEAEMGLTSEISKEEEALLNNDDCEGRDAATIQSRDLVQLILRDLETLKKMADYQDPKELN